MEFLRSFFLVAGDQFCQTSSSSVGVGVQPSLSLAPVGSTQSVSHSAGRSNGDQVLTMGVSHVNWRADLAERLHTLQVNHFPSQVLAVSSMNRVNTFLNGAVAIT